MAKVSVPQLSVVVPLLDEADGLAAFHLDLLKALRAAVKGDCEVIYVDDGSSDKTAALVAKFRRSSSKIKLIKLSRNFGKENALAAGIAAARGQAVLTIDGDGQHPPEIIPDFVTAWRLGAQVVVGVRVDSMSHGWGKRLGSKLFYKLFNALTDQKMLPGSTDYRLMDRQVVEAFLQLGESDRMTRSLVDWLGFKRQLIPFAAQPRQAGHDTHNKRGLTRLATNAFVSFSPRPLYFFGYLGILITIFAFLLGGAVIVEQLLLGDPWNWNFTGTAMLGILILFLVGIVLLSQGILSLYVSHIHAQAKGRPLYIIDREGSDGIDTQ